MTECSRPFPIRASNARRRRLTGTEVGAAQALHLGGVTALAGPYTQVIFSRLLAPDHDPPNVGFPEVEAAHDLQPDRCSVGILVEELPDLVPVVVGLERPSAADDLVGIAVGLFGLQKQPGDRLAVGRPDGELV